MAKKRTQRGQVEIEGTESPERIPELHALGLELKDLESRRMELQREENEKRSEAGAELHKRGLEEYNCDGVSLWIEPGKEKVKCKLDADED